MSIVSKTLKLILSPARFQSSLWLPVPQLRPLLRFSTTTATYKSQQNPPHQEQQCYGRIYIFIAGTKHYAGIASRGETLVVRREHENEHDCNAFRIDKTNGAQIGHVPAYLAKSLAPLVDEGVVTLQIKAREREFATIQVFGAGKMDPRVKMLLKPRVVKTQVRPADEELYRQFLPGPTAESFNNIDLFMDFRPVSIKTPTGTHETVVKTTAKRATMTATMPATKKSGKKSAKKAAKAARKKAAKGKKHEMYEK